MNMPIILMNIYLNKDNKVMKKCYKSKPVWIYIQIDDDLMPKTERQKLVCADKRM